MRECSASVLCRRRGSTTSHFFQKDFVAILTQWERCQMFKKSERYSGKEAIPKSATLKMWPCEEWA